MPRSREPDFPSLAPWCELGDHDDCPHAWGAGGGCRPTLRGLKSESYRTLCQCGCHDECRLTALGSRRFGGFVVDKGEWPSGCDCPGRRAHVEREARVSARAEEWRENYRLAMAEVDTSQFDSAAELQKAWHEALRRNGIEPTPGQLRRTAELTIAGQSSHWLKGPRMVATGTRALWDLRRFLAENRAEGRKDGREE